MAKFSQPTLSGGELSPGLQGRTDLARYATSLALCRNVIVKPTGGAAKRSGTHYLGQVKYSDKYTRLIPFVYSTQVKYLIEAGDLYFRFWVNGSLLTDIEKPITFVTQSNWARVTSPGHGFISGTQVLVEGVRGMDKLNGRTYMIANATTDTFDLYAEDSTDYTAYAGGGTVKRIVELVTPYTEAMLPNVKFTQSADVLFLVHQQVPILELRRLTAASFELRNFNFRRGPFRSFNLDEAAIVAVNGTQGNVTVTSNVDLFTGGMIGSLLYLEEKELRSIKPWSSAERNVPVGALRRSDQKVYRAASVPSTAGGAGAPYYITGGTQPTHNVGRAFDGPQDKRSDGVNDYWVGVEWEFLHNVFGIVLIYGVTNARAASATVIDRIPDSLVGTAPAPAAGPFPFVGDGVTTTFSTPGITSNNPVDFVVTLNGSPVQSNPNYPGGGGVAGGGGGNPRPGNEMGNIQPK